MLFQEPTIPGASIANLKWWELFQDEELTRLIEMALINNKEVAIAMGPDRGGPGSAWFCAC